MSLKSHSVVVHEISDGIATAVDAIFRDGKLISATAVARQILEENPESGMTVDELSEWIGRLAAARGVSVEFGSNSN